MNLLSRSLCILFPPRLPRFGPEDVAGTAEYYNRLARHHEASLNPPGAWIGRISTELAVRIQLFKTARKVRQQILRRAASRSKSLGGKLLENEWRIVLQK
jgi:hypothetical protein